MRKGRGKRGRGKLPSTLTAVYGEGRLQCLREYILRCLGPSLREATCCCNANDNKNKGNSSSSRNSTEFTHDHREPCPKCNPRGYVVREEDHVDYWTLLESSYVVLPTPAPPMQLFSLENRWSQRQVVDRAVEIHLRESYRPFNVMCSGYQKAWQKTSVYSYVTAFLNSDAWMCLLSRVGDMFMLNLLLHVSLFYPLPNQCYLQLLGIPTDNFLTSKKVCPSQTAVERECILQFSESSAVLRMLKRSETKEANNVVPLSLDCRKRRFEVIASASDGASEKKETTVSCSDGAGKTKEQGNKRRRPFRWQRRKKTKAQKNVCTMLAVSTNNSLSGQDLHPEIPVGTDRKANKEVVNSECRKQLSVNANRNLISFPDDATLLKTQITHALTNCLENPHIQEECATDVCQQESCRGCKKFAFHLKKSISPDSLINRKPIFYNSRFFHCGGFPKYYMLNGLKSNNNGGNQLMKDIFGLSSSIYDTHVGYATHLGNRCITKMLLSSLKHLIRRFQSCPYIKLLDRHCSKQDGKSTDLLPELASETFETNLSLRNNAQKMCHISEIKHHPCVLNGTMKKMAERHSNLTSRYSTHAEVVSFAWAVIRRVVPEHLLGSKYNWRALRRNLAQFIGLGRFENFTLENCLYRLKASQFFHMPEHHIFSANDMSEFEKQVFSKGKIQNEHRGMKAVNLFWTHRMLPLWIFWLFSHFIVPLISSHFYVTESENGKCHVFYYRKDVWFKVSKEAMRDLRKRNYTDLNMASVANIVANRTLGFSRVRFLPKSTGVRPVANLGTASKLNLNRENVLQKVGRSRERKEFQLMDRSRNHWNIDDSTEHGLPRRKSVCLLTCQTSDGKEKFYSSSPQVNISFKSINFHLYDAHHCLKYEQEEYPEALGCSVFDYNDVYRKLVPFLLTLKACFIYPHKFYIVACDVSKAFDTISHDKLSTVMDEVLKHDEYLVRKYKRISFLGKRVRVIHERCVIQENKESLYKYLPAYAAKHPKCIIIEQAMFTSVMRQELISLINEHIKRNILKIGKQFYIQNTGIPQGSVLSSLLCSFYYGHLDNNKILPLLNQIHDSNCLSLVINNENEFAGHTKKNVQKVNSFGALATPSVRRIEEMIDVGLRSITSCSSYPECAIENKMIYEDIGQSMAFHKKIILLRFIDDFLLISASKQSAAAFVSAMYTGFEEYNCHFNQQKTAINFDMEVQEKNIQKNMHTSDDGSCFIPWAGLLINANSLEVQADYTRYCSTAIRSTISVWRQEKPGYNLTMKMLMFIRPKCHPILYDININSPATVRLNIYQVFLLCAMKFHSYLCSSPAVGAFSAKHCFMAIMKTSRYFFKLLTRRMQTIRQKMNHCPRLSVYQTEIELLSLLAFSKILSRKQSRHKQLLHFLEKMRTNVRYKDLLLSADLQNAVDDSRSSVFSKIKY